MCVCPASPFPDRRRQNQARPLRAHLKLLTCGGAGGKLGLSPHAPASEAAVGSLRMLLAFTPFFKLCPPGLSTLDIFFLMKDGRYLSVCKLCYTCPIFLSESQGVFQSGKTHGSWVHVRLWVHVGCSLTHIVTRNPARVTSARLIHKTTPRVTRTQIMAGSIRAQTCTPSSIQIPPPHGSQCPDFRWISPESNFI